MNNQSIINLIEIILEKKNKNYKYIKYTFEKGNK